MTTMRTDDERRAHADRVIDTLLESLRRPDMREFANQWALDGVMEFPFAPPGYPLLKSRDDVWNYVKDYTDKIRLHVVTEHRRHHTLDPGTVILEFSVDGTAVQTGNDYHMSYISVITIDQNGIQHYRDYWNSLAVAMSLGGVEALMTEFGSAGDA